MLLNNKFIFIYDYILQMDILNNIILYIISLMVVIVSIPLIHSASKIGQEGIKKLATYVGIGSALAVGADATLNVIDKVSKKIGGGSNSNNNNNNKDDKKNKTNKDKGKSNDGNNKK